MRWILLGLIALLGFACDDDETDGEGSADAGLDRGPPGPAGDWPPANAELVFAAIGDFGDTDDLADGETNTLRVATQMKSWDPAFIITVGDNDYTDGEFAGTNRGLELGTGQYFHAFIGNYQGVAGPGSASNRFFPAPGDHDYGDDCDDPRLDDYLAYFTLPGVEGDERFYSVRQGPVEVFSIDSVVDCHQDGGAFLARQQAWLQTAAAASDAAFKIVAFHHPPYSSGVRHGSAEYMQWPFADYGIDLVLGGDDHIYERVERDGVTYLVIGLGGVERHPIGPGIEGSQVRYADEFGALGLAVVGEQLHVAFVTAEGTVIDRFALGEAPTARRYEPAPGATWHWQLQGQLNTSYDVEAYDIDLVDTDAAAIATLQADGRKIICYFSAGSYEDFRPDAAAFMPTDLGEALDGFADERWLDVRSANVRRIMQARLDLAVSKGCDAVEPDNLDGYANENGVGLTAADQLDYNRFIAAEAHARGLSVGLKNDLDQIPDLIDAFDFAVNEQCYEYDECAALSPFIDTNKAVFNAEYEQRFVDDAQAREMMCATSQALELSTLILPVDLNDSLRITCDD